MSPRAILVAAVLLLGTGCAMQCDPDSSCPTPVSIRGECQAERSCDVDGVMGWCVTGDCHLARKATLTVPLTTVSLKGTPDLYVDYGEAAGAPDPLKIEATLDGVKGKAARFDAGSGTEAAIVRFDPMPAHPKALTLRFDDGTATFVDPRLQFEDATCERDHAAACAP